MRKFNIIFEGIDLAGKTTLISAIRDFYAENNHKLNTKYHINPPVHIREEVFNPRLDDSERDDLFLRGFVYNDVNLVNGLNITDRSFLTNLAYSTDVVRKNRLSFLYENVILKPDLVVILFMSDETIKERYGSRELDHFEKVTITELKRRQNEYIDHIVVSC